ncbi:MAG: putative holo-[acyl-carrier-protein] synthase [Ramlibacter sp.]|nr:putative holo-[acyl-carrier-protein] synthase [Ramlibacter sp.]
MFKPEVGQADRGDARWAIRLGFDLVQVSQVADSLQRFGAAYEQRLFTTGEIEYAHGGQTAERLAARFAAKEAMVKALKLGEAGVSLREIEVCKQADGSCEVRLHGRTAELAAQMGVGRILLSLSHDGDYAGAFVTVLQRPQAEFETMEVLEE